MSGTGYQPDGTREVWVGLRALRRNLTRYLREVRRGASVLVTTRCSVIAEIRLHVSPKRAVRQPGARRGAIIMSDDFDVIPADLLAAIE